MHAGNVVACRLVILWCIACSMIDAFCRERGGGVESRGNVCTEAQATTPGAACITIKYSSETDYGVGLSFSSLRIIRGSATAPPFPIRNMFAVWHGCPLSRRVNTSSGTVATPPLSLPHPCLSCCHCLPSICRFLRCRPHCLLTELRLKKQKQD